MFCDECGYKNKENAKFCKKCGASLIEENLQDKKDVEKVLEEEFDNSQDNMQLTKKQLLEYLNIGKELEINKLGLENSISDLTKLNKQKYQEIVKPLAKDKNPKFKTIDVSTFGGIFSLIATLAIPLYFVNIYLCGKFYDQFFYKFFKWDTPTIFTAIPVTLVVGIILFLVIGVIYFIYHNIFGRQKYLVQVKKYKKECEEIDKKNNNQIVIYNEKKEVIDGRIKNLNKDIEDTEKTLNKYYDLDVIYPKYRNLIAITTFIEYLESGRCKSLYGYTGCYNVYEQELRQNTIIGKLDQVLVQLDQIKKVQFATYLAIEQSNALQSAMLNTCNAMLDEQSRATATLEAQAQDTKIMKRNSEIVSTITTLNYIKK